MDNKYRFGAVKVAIALAFSIPLAARAQDVPAVPDSSPAPAPAPDASAGQTHHCEHHDASAQWQQQALTDAQSAASQAASQAVNITPCTIQQCIDPSLTQTAAQDVSNLAATAATQQAATAAITNNLTDTSAILSQTQAIQSAVVDTSAIQAQTQQVLQQVTSDPGLNNAVQSAASQAAAQSTQTLQNLDFSSTQAIYQAPNTSSVDISVGGALSANGSIAGGTTHTINPGDMLTAAQLEAVQNIMSGANQGVLLGSQGQAIGGLISLAPNNIAGGENLIVPNSVSLGLLGFDSSNPFNAGGSSSISGSVYALQNAPNLTSVLNFGSLNISTSGLLTGNMGDLLGLSGWYSSNILLNVTSNLVNAGTISSPGNLAINAGMIDNSGLIAAQTGNLNMIASMGQIANTGALTAALGNININSGANLALMNNSGLIQALNGQINIGDITNESTRNLTITGGDLISKELNLYAGQGLVDVAVGELQGQVSSHARDLHLSAATDNLVLGDIHCLGDPLFYNTGNITIGGSQTFGEVLSIVATGNITATSGGTFVLQAGDGTQGYNINLVAGVTITPTLPNTTSSTVPGTPATNGITVGTGGTGGDIDFSTASVTLSSRPTTIDGSNRNAGNILLAAFTNNAGNAGGHILLSNTSVLDARSDGTGTNGTVTLIAGAASGTAITTGSILTNNGTNGGAVAISVAPPTIPAPGTTMTFTAAGVPSKTITAGTLRAGNIDVNANISSAGTVNISTTGSLLQSAGTISAPTSVSMQGSAGISQTAGANIITTGAGQGNLTLTANSNNAAIGSSSARINFDANNLVSASASGTNGDVFLQEANDVEIAGSFTAARTFNLLAGNNITNATGADTITSANVVLNSTNSSIGSSTNNILISATNLTATANSSGQNVFITESNGVEIAGAQGAGGTYSLIATAGNITNATNNATDIIAAQNVILQAATGSIGVAANRVLINADNLTANVSANNQNVFIGESDNVNIGAASGTGTGGNFNLLAVNNITDTGAVLITAPTVVLASTSGSIGDGTNRIQINANNLTATANATSQNVFVQEADSVEILGSQGANSTYDLLAGVNITNNTTAGDVITAANIVLTSSAGSVGIGTGTRVQINATNLTVNANAADQDVFIQEASSVEIAANSGAGRIFNLATSAGAITDASGSTITAPTVVLTAVSATNGSIGTSAAPVKINTSNITATASSNNQSVFLEELDSVEIAGAQGAGVAGTYRLVAGGNITNATNPTADVITAPNVILTSTAGSIGLSGTERINITATNLTANATATDQDIFISESNGVEIAGAQGAGRTYNLISATGNITNSTATATDIITAPNVVLTATTGSIGTSTARVNINADNLTANVSANNQSIFIGETDNINIGGASGAGTGGTFNLLAANNITDTGAVLITAPTVVLSSSSGSIGSSAARIQTNATNLTATANATDQDVFIQEADSVEIAGVQGANRTYDLLAGTNITNATGTDTITATNVVLTSTSGSIGLSSTTRINISAVNLAANANAADQDIFLQEATSVDIAGASGAGRTFNLVASNGSITDGTGVLITAQNLTVSAFNGSIGTSTNRLNMNVDNINATASSANQSVFLNESDNVEIRGAQGASGTNGVYNLLAAGNITNATNPTGDTITAINTVLTSSGGSVGIGSTERIQISSTNLTVSANQNAYISEANSVELAGAQTASGIFDLSTINGSITNATNNAGDVISATTVNLSTTGGGIGSSTARINTDATNLSANALSNNNSVFISEANSVELAGNSSAGVALGTFNLIAGASITNATNPTGDTISSQNVILNSSTGSIGDSTNRVQINAANITANAATSGQNVFLQEADSVEINGVQGAGGTYSILSGLNITNATNPTGDLISATTIDLSSTAGNVGTSTTARVQIQGTNLIVNANGSGGEVHVAVTGSVELDGNIQAASLIDLAASGSITDSTSPAAIVVPTLILTSATGSIGTTLNPIFTNVDNLTANATAANQNVFIAETDNVEIGGTSSAATGTGTFRILANGNITNATNPTGDVISGSNVILTSGNGSIGTGTAARVNINASNMTINASSGDVFMSEANGVEILGNQSAGGTFNLVVSAGNLTNVTTSTDIISASSVVLQTSTGSIGTTTARVNVDATDLTANAPANNQNVFISEANSVNIGGASGTGTGGTFNLLAANNITDTGAVVITAPTIVLSSSVGSIGDSTNRVQISATNLTVSAIAANQSVYLNEADSVELLGASSVNSASGTFDLTAATNITNNNTPLADVLTGGTVVLTATSGSIGASTSARINTSAVNLTANAGADVFISEANSVEIGGNSQAGGIFNLTTVAGSITNATNPTGDTITAPTLVLNATAGSIGTLLNRINIDAGILSASANSNNQGVFLNEANTVEIGASNSASGTNGVYNLVADTDITNNAGTDTITATTISLVSTNGSVGNSTGRVNVSSGAGLTVQATSANGDAYIGVTGNIEIGTNIQVNRTFDLLASGNITNTTNPAGDVITAANVNLTSTTGSIGSNVARININADNLTAIANANNQNVFLNESDSVEIAGPSAAGSGGTFNLIAGNNITNDTNNATDVIGGSTISLVSTSGSVGTSAAGRIQVSNGAAVTVTANAANQDAFVGITGGIEINGGIQANRTINILASGNITNNTNPSGDTITATNITLESTTGSIGTSTNSVNVSSSNLTANANASGQSVFINSAGIVEIAGASGAGDTFSLGAAGGITNAANPTGDQITATNVVLNSSAGSVGASGARINTEATNLTANASAPGQNVYINDASSVEIAGPSGAGSIFDLVATLSITNSTNPTGDQITASDIVLTSTSESIGASGARINIDATNLTVNANQDVYLNEAGSVEIAGSSGSFGIFDLLASGDITNNTNPAGDQISTVDLTLTSTSGSIGASGARININANSLIANAAAANQNVFINSTGQIEIAGPSGAGNTFDLLASGSITNFTNPTGDQITATSVVLNSTNGSIGTASNQRINIDATNVTANATAANQDIFLGLANGIELSGNINANRTFDLLANGSITNNTNPSGDVVTATNIVLTSTTGSIGDATNRINIDGVNLTSQADASGQNVYLQESDDIELSGNNSADNIWSLIAGGSITDNTAPATVITATSIDLQATGDIGTPTNRIFVSGGVSAVGQNVYLGFAGDLEIDGTITADPLTGTIDLFATGSITNDINPTGDVLTALNVILNAQNGSVGNSTNAINTDTPNLTANASTAGQNVYINNVGTGDVEITGPQAAGNVYSLTANGSITNDINPTGDLITATTVSLTSNNGNIGSSTTAPINTEAGDLSFSAAGEVHINEASAVQVVQGQAGAGSVLEIIADGNITTPSGIFLTADTVILESINGSVGLSTTNRVNVAANFLTANANAANQDVFIFTQADIDLGSSGGPSGADRTFDLETQGSMADSSGTSTITAENVVLRSVTGDIGLAGPINTEAVNLTANAPNGWVIIQEASDVEIGGDSSSSMMGEFILLAGGNITNETNPTGDIISSGEVDLETLDGSIGSTTGRINIQAGEISVLATNAAGTADAYLHADGDIELCGPNQVDRTFDLIAEGNIMDMGPASGPWVFAQNAILTSISGSIGTVSDEVELQANNLTLNANSTFGNVYVQNDISAELLGNSSSGSAGTFNLIVLGDLTNNTDPADTITASYINLTTNGGSIGDAANNININADTLTANSSGGGTSVFLNETNSVELTGASSADNTFSLAAQDTISDFDQDASITATNIILSSANGSVGTNDTQRINITATTLDVSAAAANQNVYINSTGNIELDGLQEAGSIYDLVANGNITDLDASSIIAAPNVALTTQAGSGGSIGDIVNTVATAADNLTVNSDVDAFITESDDVEMQGTQTVNGTYDLFAFGSINNQINPTGDLITADTIVFESFTGFVGGDFVGPNGPININANNLTVNAFESVVMTEVDHVNVDGFNSGFNFYLEAGNGITLTPGATIQGFGGETFLHSLNGNITGDSTSLVSNLDMSLIADNGNIGDMTGGQRFIIDSGFLELIASGNVFVEELDNTAIDLPSSAGGVFDLISTNTGFGPTLIINTAPITAQSINIDAADFLSIANNLTATNGDITTDSSRLTTVGSLVRPVTLSATGDITMTAPNFLIASPGGPTSFNAGAPGSNGNVLITATGAGGIGIGNNVTMTSQGGNLVAGVQEPGSVGLVATAGNIRIGDNFGATATGGNVFLSAANNMNIVGTGAVFTATVAYDPRGGETTLPSGVTVYNGIGGGIAVGGGGSVPASGDAFLAGLAALRPTVVTAGLSPTNTLNLSGAPYMAAVGNVAGMINSIFNVAGGPVFVSNANFNGATFNSTGAGVVPPTPVPGGGGTPGGGGGTGGAGAGLVFDGAGGTNTADLTSKIPTDQTKILEGFVEKQLHYVKGTATNFITGSKTFSHQFDQNGPETARLIKEGVVLASNSSGNYLNLDKGNVVFAPSQDIVVGTHEGAVHIPKGAIVLIMETGADVAIANLHQTNTKDVKIVSGGKLLSLCPGRAMLLSREDTEDFEDVSHPFQLIGYRKPDVKKLDGNITAFKMEFSIPSAMSKMQPLRQMLNSSNAAEKKAVRNILMNAIMLQEKTIYRGPFMTTGDISQ